MGSPALRLNDVTFRYQEQGKRNILDHVSLDIPAGRITVIMGRGGCGKSTLASVAAGLYPENGGILVSGSVELFGKPLAGMNQQERARYLTLMFQNPDLQFCMDTLRKELRFCLENICVPREEMDRRGMAAAQVLGLSDKLDQAFNTLSGGEKQRAMLCCLYAMESGCIMLDEALANIDHAAALDLVSGIAKLRGLGRTVIAIDHRLDYWLDVADEIIVLGEGGKLLGRGICRENLGEYRCLFEQEGLYYPKRSNVKADQGCDKKLLSVGTGKLRSGKADHGCDENLSIAWTGTLSSVKGGSECGDESAAGLRHELNPTAVKLKGNQNPPEAGLRRGLNPPAVELKGVSIPLESEADRWGRKKVKKWLLSNVDAVFPKNCMTAVIGPSGSGKTTTFLSILKQHPYKGDILINGQNLGRIRERELFAQVGMVFQNPGNQFITQTVEEEVCSAIRQWEGKHCEEKAEALLEAYDLKRYRRFSPYMLSQGQQRRLAVVSVLAGRQKLLFLDEPTYGQDLRSTEKIMERLRDEVGIEGLTVVFITHDLELAAAWADKIYVLRNQKLNEVTGEELLENEE